MVSASFLQIINGISTEHDSSFLASLYRCFNDALRVVGGPAALPRDFHDGVIEATKRQLQMLADKRRARANRIAHGNNNGLGVGGEAKVDLEDEREDMALLEEIEDFALEDMAKMLAAFDPAHPLLVAVSSVKDLGISQYEDSDEEVG